MTDTHTHPKPGAIEMAHVRTHDSGSASLGSASGKSCSRLLLSVPPVQPHAGRAPSGEVQSDWHHEKCHSWSKNQCHPDDCPPSHKIPTVVTDNPEGHECSQKQRRKPVGTVRTQTHRNGDGHSELSPDRKLKRGAGRREARGTSCGLCELTRAVKGALSMCSSSMCPTVSSVPKPEAVTFVP